MALRAQLLPRDERITELAQSALDPGWMDQVETEHGVFITAEGLLMYLKPDDALGLIRDCAARFPGGQMMFDSIPHWFSRRTLAGLKLSDRYVAPPMPFGLTVDEGWRWPTAFPACAPPETSPFHPGAASGNGRRGHRWTGSASCAASAPASRCWNSADRRRAGRAHQANLR